MDIKYTYLFRQVGDTKISSCFIPLKMMPAKLSHILQMLKTTHSCLTKFQIGVQTETNGKKEIIWNPVIFNVCENIAEEYNQKPNEITLDKNFNMIFNNRMQPNQIANKMILLENLVR